MLLEALPFYRSNGADFWYGFVLMGALCDALRLVGKIEIPLPIAFACDLWIPAEINNYPLISIYRCLI